MALGFSYKPEASEPEVRSVVLTPPKIGAVTFHNLSEPTSGVACVGTRAATNFNRRTELASDTIWISDAKGATNAQNFRYANYLRCTTNNIAEDLGVVLQDTVMGLPRVAETIGRVRDIVAHSYPWTNFSQEWSHQTLAASIAKILSPLGSSETPEELESAFTQAFQSYSMVPDIQGPIPGNVPQKLYSLRSNRLRYAQYICKTQIPSGRWQSMLVPEGGNALKLDDYLNPNKPCIVEASIDFSTSLSAAVTPALTAFGSSRPNGNSAIRKWISQIELAWLVEHANVYITSAFCAQGSTDLPTRLQLPVSITADPVYSLSISAGIVAENHWVALSQTTSKRRAGNSATSVYYDVATPMAVWLRAADRAYCFSMAKIVAERGFVVTGYGYGSVNFYGPRNDIARIAELADELGTCHPCLASMENQMLAGPEA